MDDDDPPLVLGPKTSGCSTVSTRAPIQANRVLAVVRKMFNFAIERDWLDVNPCGMIKRVVKEQAGDRVRR